MFENIFRGYDIRGKVPDELNSQVAFKAGLAFARSVYDNGKVVIGSDLRPCNSRLKSAFTAGLLACGVDVIDLGIVPTDAVSFAVPFLKEAKWGVMISSSHLPIGTNGIKILESSGIRANPSTIFEPIKHAMEKGIFKEAPSFDSGKVEFYDIKSDYVNRAVKVYNSLFNDDLSDSRIVIDGCNSVGNIFGKAVLEELNANVKPIFNISHGRFARDSEPSPESLSRLAKVAKGYDIGFGFDGDADRIVPVANTGVFPDTNALFCFLSELYLKFNKKIVYNIEGASFIEDFVKSRGGEYFISPVGDVHVARMAFEVGARFSGEPSCHYCDFDFSVVSSGSLFAAVIPGWLNERGWNCSDINKNYPVPFYVRAKINVSDKNLLMDKIKKKLKESIISDLDGVKFRIPDGSVLIRASNTENVVRVVVENLNKAVADSNLLKYSSFVNGLL